MEISYTYKITFEEVPHFYIGVRKLPKGKTPETDNYLGTPKTHKNYWEIYTPKKQIFGIYFNREEAYRAEETIIRSNWRNKYCLNESIGGMISIESLAKAAKTRREKYNNNPELYKKRRRISSEVCKRTQDRISQNEELSEIRRKRNSSAGTKGGLKGAKIQHSQRWLCTVTGFISTPCGLSHFQKKRGIDTKNRVKLPSDS